MQETAFWFNSVILYYFPRWPVNSSNFDVFDEKESTEDKLILFWSEVVLICKYDSFGGLLFEVKNFEKPHVNSKRFELFDHSRMQAVLWLKENTN